MEIQKLENAIKKAYELLDSDLKLNESQKTILENAAKRYAAKKIEEGNIVSNAAFVLGYVMGATNE